MTVNYFIKCPICGKITRMRSPAGYVYSTPVRIHSGSCRTLLTGNFISDYKHSKAYFKPDNCEEVFDVKYAYDYIGEASGEMICNKIRSNRTGGLEYVESPVFEFMNSFSLEDMENFINYASYLSNLNYDWNNERIKYDLFLNGNYELIKKKYHNIALTFGYSLENEFDCVRFIYFSFFRDLCGIYNNDKIEKLLIDINYRFSHINKNKLLEFINELNTSNRLLNAQNAIFKILFNFVDIAPNIIPAIGVCNYYDRNSIDKEQMGISTCTFDDISNFYQRTYETLVEYSDIVVALDNVLYRNDYKEWKDDNPISEFIKKEKGNRIKHINNIEFFEEKFNMKPNANRLRNAIGHNEYEFDGVLQEIKFKKSKNSNEIEKMYLIDVSMECIDLIRSTLVLSFCIYEIIRYSNPSLVNSLLPKFFYKGTSSQSRCPCGSNIKYNKCCKNKLRDINYSYNLYPNVAQCVMDVNKSLKHSINK